MMSAIVWEADPVTFQFTYVSRGAEQLLGHALEHWLSRPHFWTDLLHPDDRDYALNTCRSAVDACRDHELEYRMIAADGRVLWIRDIVRVISGSDGKATALHGAMLDVSEWKQADTLGKLTRALAHDFNNVLFAIRGYVWLCLEATDPGTMRADLDEILKAVDVGSALASRFLAAGDRQLLPVEVIDVHSTLHSHEQLMRRLLGASVRYVPRFEAPHARVHLQRGQLEQIVINLAINARHAMPDGGELTIVTQVDPWGIERPDGTFGDLIIEVTDTGVGIAAEIIDRIFDPHFTTKLPGQGTGLGLSTVQAIVTEAGGSISVRSAVGEGTTFGLRFPLA